jgi:hypothetical protein
MAANKHEAYQQTDTPCAKVSEQNKFMARQMKIPNVGRETMGCGCNALWTAMNESKAK